MGVGLQYILCQCMMYKPASMSAFLSSKHQSVLIYPSTSYPNIVHLRYSDAGAHPSNMKNAATAAGQPVRNRSALVAACACSLQKWIYSSIGCVCIYMIYIYIYIHMQNYADMISTKIFLHSEYPWLGVTIFTKGGPGTSDSQRLFGFEPRIAQNSPAPGMICMWGTRAGIVCSKPLLTVNPSTFKRYPSCPSHCPSHLG